MLTLENNTKMCDYKLRNETFMNGSNYVLRIFKIVLCVFTN